MSAQLRTTVFVLANLGVLLLAVAGSASAGLPAGRAAYVIVLFCLCSAPVLLLDRINGRHALLAIFMSVYFVYFGALDMLNFATAALSSIPEPPEPAPTFWSAAECGILLGGLCLAACYVIAASGTERPIGRPTDWPRSAVLLVGLLLWLVGSAALVYFQVFVLNEKTTAAATRGLASLGPVKTFAVLLANLLQPLGILLLAYGYARFRSGLWLITILSVVLIQVGIGFVTDMKATAMIAGILVILAKTFCDNRLPKAWLIASAACLVVIFPIFQAYRSAVTGDRGLTRSAALQEIGKVIEITLASREKAANGADGSRSQSFLERSSMKANVELAFEHTGVDTPFLNGLTLLEVPLAFIPRLIWPDKPGAPTGLLFNRAFYHGDNDTYISPSHLGELYWNFGWGGVIVGMSAIGVLLGFIARKTSLAERMTLTRFLVLIATVKATCLQFEGAVGVAYVVWLRSLGAIGVLHLLFARARAPSNEIGQSVQGPEEAVEPPPRCDRTLVPRFSNLMR
jgi:hypothetical protein